MTLNANDSCSRDNCSCSLSPTDALRSRVGGVKVRHKRQVLQDMARPLKHWLYKHRDNPYPTKTEKVLLALGSHMTLVQVRGDALSGFIWASLAASRFFNKVPCTQVSNWFANARRRLKNTVRQPDLSWALRIKLYNNYIQGNAERLSVCSDDTDTDGTSSQLTVGPAVRLLDLLAVSMWFQFFAVWCFFWCPLCCRWGVPPSNTPEPVAVLQVVPRRRAPEAGRCPHQRGRRRLPSVKVQEQLAQPLPERHTAAHDGSGGARRRPGPQEEEPLWVVQLHGGRPRGRLAGVILRSRGQLCPSEGWEMPPLFLLDLMWKFPVWLIKIYVYHAATWHFN